MAEYDNNNRGALFTNGKPAFCGKANFNGLDYYATIFSTDNKAEKAPSHKLILELQGAERGDTAAQAVPLWRDAPDKPSVASGKYEGHFVNVYMNKTDDGRSYLTVKFAPMEKQATPAAATSTAPPPADEDIPF